MDKISRWQYFHDGISLTNSELNVVCISLLDLIWIGGNLWLLKLAIVYFLCFAHPTHTYLIIIKFVILLHLNWRVSAFISIHLYFICSYSHFYTITKLTSELFQIYIYFYCWYKIIINTQILIHLIINLHYITMFTIRYSLLFSINAINNACIYVNFISNFYISNHLNRK